MDYLILTGVFLATFIVGTLVAYLIHWSMHQRWTGLFFQSHMEHHVTLYPPGSLVSEVYRSSGSKSGWITFTPFVTLFALSWAGLLLNVGLPAWMAVVSLVEVAVIGWLHGYAHDQMHVGSGINRWASHRVIGTHFLQLWWRHATHHDDMDTNYGILWFGWDRVFGTFK